MRIEGSCHCQSIEFEIETDWFHPFMWCYCGTCRKTNGSPVSPYIKGIKENLDIQRGKETLGRYDVRTNQRSFCRQCGSSLFLADTRWPQWCWLLASAIDSPLPPISEPVHIFVGSKAPWFPIHAPGSQYDEYPELSIEEFHIKLGLCPKP